jgi:L-cysteine/cystine lyase
MPSIDSNHTEYRQQFPALANKTYFNYGGQGVLSARTIAAIMDEYQQIQTLGPFGVKTNARATKICQQTRESIALELGTNASNIALTENVTVGCNIGLWGVDWQAGDRLLLSDCEHPGIIASVKELQRRFKIEIDTLPLLNNNDPITAIVDRLQPRTRMVVISHVLWNTGRVIPLPEIVGAIRNYTPGDRSILILVDAAQSVGLLPLNLDELDVDCYAFTGHKWWCGPEGVGGVYLNPRSRAIIRPTFIGWRGVDFSEDLSSSNCLRYEVATSAYPLYRGLQHAIDGHQQWGTTAARFDRIIASASYLWHGLQQIDGINCILDTPPQSGLISFQIANAHHDRLVRELESEHIFLRTILFPDCVRACVHYFTTTSEIDSLLDRLGAWVKSNDRSHG